MGGKSDYSPVQLPVFTFIFVFRYMACPMPNCNKGFTIKHHLTKHLRNAHANKQSSPISPPRRISGKRAISATGKYTCYFDSCDAYFDTSDLLNDHLAITHGLSIVKNAGKLSKMEVIFSDQIKSQKDEHDHAANNNQMVQQQQQHQQQHQMQQQQISNNHMVASIISSHGNDRLNGLSKPSEELTVRMFKCHMCNILYENERDFKVHSFYKHPGVPV